MTPGAPGASLPRVLAGVRGHGVVDLRRHLAVHGPPPARTGDLIGACEQAALRGRGGAAFPTAAKLAAVAARRGRKVVVVNGAEGEPMSAKDRVVLERVPHLVLDGAAAAAVAVGADDVVVAVPTGAIAARAALGAAIAERGDGRHVRVEPVPEAFLTGEETALVQALEGRRAVPTVSPPRPSERGLGRRPTLVQNAETLAHLALVARHGPAWFRALGPPGHPGSALVTLGGAVRAAGVHEIALGTNLQALLDALGEPEPVRAVLLGGYHGTWVDAAAAPRLTLDRDALAAARATLGAGVVVVLPRSACPVSEVARVVGWLAGETAGQCGPCVHGLSAIGAELAGLTDARGAGASLDRLRRWSGQVAGRGACHHPDGTARFLLSALEVFEPEFELHRRFGACEDCARRPVLRLPEPAVLAA